MSDKPKVLALNEWIARRLEGLAQRVRDCEVIGFDLAWNVGHAAQDPSRFFGVMVANASRLGEFLECLEYEEDRPPEDPKNILRDINAALATTAIEVEDRTTPDTIVCPPEPPPEEEVLVSEDDPDYEDFHIIDPDEEESK